MSNNHGDNKEIKGQQHTAEFEHEKMERKYGDETEHKHNKDHHKVRNHEPSHPHTQHGGDPVGHKHPVKKHDDRHENKDHKHHKVKKHDHKKPSREHHKKENKE